MNKKIIVSIIAILANLLLALGKLIVGAVSNSASILADGINSGTDVVASIISSIGIKIAEKPADKEHPYGHGKAEVISGFVITIIIFLSGLYIVYDAIRSFFVDTVLSLGILAFSVMALSALVNFIMSQIKIHYGKKYDSVSLVSDGVHSRIDLLVSLGIFLGLFLTRFYSEIDSILALIVGLYILKESVSLGRETTDSLLGKSAGEEIENKIKEIVKEEKIELKDLKTQKKGSSITANLTISLPKEVKVDKATSISKQIRQKIINQIKNIEYVAVQVESHDVTESYFNPRGMEIGRGFGWQRRGRFKDKLEKAEALGPGGYCVCPKGDYKVKHEKGVPCAKMKCPNHNIKLIRKERNEKN